MFRLLLSWLRSHSRLPWLTVLLVVALFGLATVYRDRYPVAQLLDWSAWYEEYPTDDVVWHPEDSPVGLPRYIPRPP